MFIDFIKSNYKEIIYVSMLFIIFILNLIKIFRKPNKVLDTLSQKIYDMLPELINLAEVKFGSSQGLNKKCFVLESIADWFSLNHYEFTEYYRSIAVKALEDILSTPQKK